LAVQTGVLAALRDRRLRREGEQGSSGS
jgi:hypothetical protein